MGDLIDATALGAIPGIHPLPNAHRPYCSLGCKHYAPVRTIEQAEKLIREVFQNTPLLCWHAVDSVNQLYQQVVHIEQGRNVDANANSFNIFKLIMTRVLHISKAVFQGPCTPRNVISYYYLQNFLAQELRVANLNHPLPRLENALRHAIAAEIPCCGSSEQFQKDVEKLLGKGWDDTIWQELEKKEQIIEPERQRLTKDLDIAACKQELSALRQHGLEYPSDYDRLVEEGFTNLYRYLNEMRTLDSHESKKDRILTMSFAQVAQVMCETYEVLVRSVEQSLSPSSTEVIFLVGDTGSGKTTAHCAITGKALALREDCYYHVENDPENIIGHGTSSCTFLPKAHEINGRILIDFPGLRDTNGWPISLIIELVLLTLANKHRAKILVLESITNREGRYQSVAELAARLERIFGTKEKFILGITKYSQDLDVVKKQQFKRSRETRCTTHRELMNAIEDSIQVFQTNIQELEDKLAKYSDVEGTQEKLEKLKTKLQSYQDKLQEKITSLEENARQLELLTRESQDELDCQKRIDNKEVELRKQIGIDPFIRFSNLESLETVEAIRTQLFQWEVPNYSFPALLMLDPSIKVSLTKLFKEQFVPSLEFQRRRFKDINTFGANVLNTSLTATVAPEAVGRFLHLPKMPPILAEQFDEEILDVCIKGYMKTIFSDPIVSYIRQLVVNLRQQNAKTLERKTEQLMNKWQVLETHIMNLLGLPPGENREEANHQWQQLKERYTIKPTEEVHLPLFLWLFLPAKIYTWLENRKKDRAEAQSLEQNLQEYAVPITSIENNLLGLQQLRTFLIKKNEINQIIQSSPLSLDSPDHFFRSINRIIEKLRSLSGVEDWNNRVLFFLMTFNKSPLAVRLNRESCCVLAATLLKTFFGLELREEEHVISINKSGSGASLTVNKSLGNNWPDEPFDQCVFNTWNISSELLKPLTCLQLIDCVMKPNVHNKTISIAREREIEREREEAIAETDLRSEARGVGQLTMRVMEFME